MITDKFPINCYECGRLITYTMDPKIRTALCIICQNKDNPQNLPTLPLPPFQSPVATEAPVIVIPELQSIADKEFGAPQPAPVEEPKPVSKSTIKKILSGKKLVPGKKKRK